MNRNRSTTKATIENVAFAANSIMAAGGRPSIRSVTSVLNGGSPNDIGPLLKKFFAGQQLVPGAASKLDQQFSQAIAEQLARVATEAAEDAKAEAAVTLDDNLLLAEVGQALEERASNLQLALDAAAGRVQHLQGQLDERARELMLIRDEASAAVASAQFTARQERECAEGLRQDLVRATLRLEAVPRMDSQIQDLGQRLADANMSLAAACQSAAVAAAITAAESKRADEAAQREAVAGAQLDKFESALAEARQFERNLRDQAQLSATALAVAEGKLAVIAAKLVPPTSTTPTGSTDNIDESLQVVLPTGVGSSHPVDLLKGNCHASTGADRPAGLST